MTKDLINKDVSEVDLIAIFNAFIELESEIKSEAKQIYINETKKFQFHKSSHFIFSITTERLKNN